METTRSTWLLPAAIIAAGAILAVSIYVLRSDGPVFGAVRSDPNSMRPVTPGEHIVGNPEAKVVIVEYADLDSARAKEFQRTLGQIMVEYGSTGNVAWVFRHFPLVNQNPNATRHAEAAECVTSLGGDTAFWKFVDMLQASAPEDDRFDPRNYTVLVKQLGLSVDAFNACVASGEFAGKVEADFENALKAGAIASPYTIVQIKGGQSIPINGSVPYSTMQSVIESALQ